MFRKAKDIVLVAVLACCLLSMVSTKLADELGVTFPEWTGVGNHSSQLEGRNYTAWPKVNLKSVVSGDFQTASEKYLSDFIPMRDNILLANAALQRACIKVANVPLGFECYPTFFGSETSVVPSASLIIPTALEKSTQNDAAAAQFVSQVNEFAAEHKDVRFVYDIIVSEYESCFNPTYEYKSGTYEPEWEKVNVISKLDPKRISIIYEPMGSFDEFKSLWLATEHHWSFERALMSYNKIAEIIGLIPAVYEDSFLVHGNWIGARNRLGRDYEYTSELFDIPTDFSQIEWKTTDGDSMPYGKRDAFLAGEYTFDTSSVYNVYDSYFGSVNTIAVNNGANNGKKCLCICTSFMRPIKGYIAQNYAETTFVAPMTDKVEESFRRLFEDGDYDDVIIQLAGYSYAGMNRVSPGFLSE